jgi:hypothetical protein
LTDKINNILRDLIGLPLNPTTRAANMQMFSFGAIINITLTSPKKGPISKSVGEFALHLQCPWRLTNENEIIVGSGDLYQQADEIAEYDENYNYYELNANLRDVKLDKLINENKLSVISINADKFGGLEICFDNNIKLNVFPDLASKADNEYWRLIDFKNEKSKYIESWSTGYETSD